MGNELRLGGSAAIASGNEVYLPGYHYIYLTDTLTGTAPVATVTPENFISGLQVLRNAEDAVSDYVSLYNGYFALKDGGDAWYIDSAGCLQNAGGISLSVPAYSSDDLEPNVAESGGSYVFSAKSGYSSYVWTINGSIQTTTENSVTLASSTLAVGSNALLLVATDSSGEVHEATATVTRTE